MQCKKHPTYKVLRAPTADCETCRVLWKTKQELIERERLAQEVASRMFRKGRMKF